jgi:hypothetical protein
MEDVVVVLGCSQEGLGLMPLYRKQLEAAGIPVYIKILTEFANTLEAQIIDQREIIAKLDCRKIIFTDAFDVLFYGTKDEVLSKIPDDKVLMGAERINWPPMNPPVKSFPGNTPWRYSNGGLSAGTPQAFLNWYDVIERHPKYVRWYKDFNQRLFNIMLYERDSSTQLDERTELFYCLPGETDELHFVDGLPVNTIYNTHPNFIHANNPVSWKISATSDLWKNLPFASGWRGDWRTARWNESGQPR